MNVPLCNYLCFDGKAYTPTKSWVSAKIEFVRTTRQNKFSLKPTVPGWGELGGRTEAFFGVAVFGTLHERICTFA
jgi:hypothetical protein